MGKLLSKFRGLAKWKKTLIVIAIIILVTFWMIVASGITEWWNWAEWTEHIKNSH